MDILNFAAPLLIIVGALLTASNLGNRLTGFGFIAFTLGSLGWLGVGILGGPSSLVWQNVVLTVLNAFGVWRWLGRERQIEKGAEKAARQSGESADPERLFPASRFANADLATTNAVAQCVDAMCDCATGAPRYLVVSAGGIAGAGETLYRIPWDHVRVSGDGFALDGPADFGQFEQVERDSWPAR
jgi:hypothetical protein